MKFNNIMYQLESVDFDQLNAVTFESDNQTWIMYIFLLNTTPEVPDARPWHPLTQHDALVCGTRCDKLYT